MINFVKNRVRSGIQTHASLSLCHPDCRGYVCRGLLSSGVMSQGVMSGGECPGGECPGGECPGGECPGGECPGGECPGGKCPGGKCPGGNITNCFLDFVSFDPLCIITRYYASSYFRNKRYLIDQ